MKKYKSAFSCCSFDTREELEEYDNIMKFVSEINDEDLDYTLGKKIFTKYEVVKKNRKRKTPWYPGIPEKRGLYYGCFYTNNKTRIEYGTVGIEPGFDIYWGDIVIQPEGFIGYCIISECPFIKTN